MKAFSIHLGWVLGELSLEDRFTRARELGFHAVELPAPYDMPAEVYAGHLRRNELTQVCIGAPKTNYQAGEVGLAVDPANRDAFRASLVEAARYARQIDCRAVHVFSGCRSADLSDEAMRDTYRTNLADAAAFFSDEGITTLIEPINSIDFPGYFLDSLDEAVTYVAEVGSPHVRIIFDVYHVCVNGQDPVAALRDVHDHVEHIQFADHPGRHEPGTGTVDFRAFIDTMRSVGYAGSAGLEYIPTRPIGEPLDLPDILMSLGDLPR